MQAKSILEAEVKQRCQAQRPGGGARGAAVPSAKEMEFFHSMGIAGMLLVPRHAPADSTIHCSLVRVLASCQECTHIDCTSDIPNLKQHADLLSAYCRFMHIVHAYGRPKHKCRG